MRPLTFKYFMKLWHILQLLLIWNKIRSLRSQVSWDMHFLYEMDIFWKSIFRDISDEIYCSLSAHIVLDYVNVFRLCIHMGILLLKVLFIFVSTSGAARVSIGYQSRGRIVFYFAFNESMPITLHSIMKAYHTQIIWVVPALDATISDE